MKRKQLKPEGKTNAIKCIFTDNLTNMVIQTIHNPNRQKLQGNVVI